jgi:hypothetical protein
MIKQELSPEQRFQRHQFGLNVLAKDIDPAPIVFSDECRFVLGSDKLWRHIRRGQWNESCFAAEEKFPESFIIWGAIGYNFKTGCQFCSIGVDLAEYRPLHIQSQMIETMKDRYGEYQ